MELLARIELATSSLPRKCSTPELQEQIVLLINGAGGGNRTRTISLEG